MHHEHVLLTLTPSIRWSWCVLIPFFEDGEGGPRGTMS
jgi:hypothetical protein